MNAKNKNYVCLAIWITAPILIGTIIGYVTKSEISSWYSTLNRSSLTPPNYVFPIAWTILYAILGICGWTIWRIPLFPNLITIKRLYAIQLILNWSWSFLFFYYHLTGISFLVLICMDVLTWMLILLAYRKIKSISLLMLPYLLWILFASYLNFYIWQHN